MKQKIINISLGLLIVAGLSAFIYGQEVPKSYAVTLTKDQWVSALGVIDSTQKLLIKSDLPVKEVVGVNNGLAQLTQTISTQVGAQLQAEQKADSTKPKTPKK